MTLPPYSAHTTRKWVKQHTYCLCGAQSIVVVFFAALLSQFMLLLWSVKALRFGWWPDSFSQLWFIIIRSLARSAGLSGIISHWHYHTTVHRRRCSHLITDQNNMPRTCSNVYHIYGIPATLFLHNPCLIAVFWILFHLLCCSFSASSFLIVIDSESEMNYG